MMLGRLGGPLALSLLLLSFAVPGARADEPGKWRFHVTPYAWATNLKGDATVRGRSFDVDADFIDTIENSDSILAFMGRVDAHNGTWGAFVDATYANLGFDIDAGPVDGELEAQIAFIDFGLAYRFVNVNLNRRYPADPEQPRRALRIDAIVGGRYTFVGSDLDLDAPVSVSVDADQDWLDPFVGARLVADLTDRFYLVVGGDVGGFGVGSEITLNGRAAIGYRFHLFEREASVLAGYRAIYQDFQDGSGARRFEYKITTHGPIAGLQLVF